MSNFPLWVIILDYSLGMIMWTLIGRFGMSLFLQDNSDFFFMKVFVKYTNPIIKIFIDNTVFFNRPTYTSLCSLVFIYDTFLFNSINFRL